MSSTAEILELYRSGERERARNRVARRLEKNPRDVDGLYLKALFSFDSDDLDNALNAVEEAIELQPNAASFHLLLGQILFRKNDIAGARVNMESALELNPNLPQGHNTLGYLQYLQGELDTARTTLETALRLDPDSIEAALNLGQVLRLQGQTGAAIAQFQTLLEEKPDSPAIRASLAAALIDSGAASFALKTLEPALARFPEPPNSLRALKARALLVDSKTDAAQTELEAILRGDPSHFEARTLAGDLAQQSGRAAAAVAHYQQALLVRRGDPIVVRKLATALVAAGQAGSAVRVYQNLAERGRLQPTDRVAFAKAWLATGDSAQARAVLETALKAGMEGEASLMLAELLLFDDRERAVALIRKARPASQSEHIRWATLAADCEMWEQAADLLGEPPEHPAARRLALRIDHMRGSLDSNQLPSEPMTECQVGDIEIIDHDRPFTGFAVLLLLPGAFGHALGDALNKTPRIEVLTQRRAGTRVDFLDDEDDDWTEEPERVRVARSRYRRDLSRRRSTEKPFVLDELSAAPDLLRKLTMLVPDVSFVVPLRAPRDMLLEQQTGSATPWQPQALTEWLRALLALRETGIDVACLDMDALPVAAPAGLYLPDDQWQEVQNTLGRAQPHPLPALEPNTYPRLEDDSRQRLFEMCLKQPEAGLSTQ